MLSVCNFQSMKSPVELGSLFLKFFCYVVTSPALIRCDTGCRAHKAFTSNPIVSLKQKLSSTSLKITNCMVNRVKNFFQINKYISSVFSVIKLV